MAVGRSFDYAVPERLGSLEVGRRVRVALAGRRVGGWVLGEVPEAEAHASLQPVLKDSGMGPPPAVVDLAAWAAWRFCGPMASFLRTASPERVITALPTPPTARPLETEPPGTLAAETVAAALGSPGQPVVARVPPGAGLLEVVEHFCHEVLGGVRGPVLVLVPELAAAERLGAALERRGLSAAFGQERFERAAAGWPVVVGARAAAWSPPGRLGGAVVLDAHDPAYQEERAPTWDAVEVVARRCALDRSPCLLVSPAPTVTLWAKGRHLVPPRLEERRGWPALEVVDLRSSDPRAGLLSAPLVAALHRGLEEARGRLPVVGVLNRKGRARLLACAACGELVRCSRCAAPAEQLADELSCRRCGARRPPLCAACGSLRLKVLRPGVSRVRQELEALLRVPVAEVAGPGGPPPADSAVVLGTEAALHRVRRAALVAFLDFDQHLAAPTFTAAEAALGLLARAGRMVGGRHRRAVGEGGLVVVQTRQPDHEVLAAAVRGDPDPLLEAEAKLRKELRLPPAAALAVVSGERAEEVTTALEDLEPEAPEVRRVEEHRVVVRAPSHDQLCDALATIGPRRAVRVEVDPRTL